MQNNSFLSNFCHLQITSHFIPGDTIFNRDKEYINSLFNKGTAGYPPKNS